MINAEQLAFVTSGVFFWVGLVCGCWKYRCIRTSEDGLAPEYVNIAHRAALMYAFAGLVVERFVVQSQLPEAVELACVSMLALYFALAQLGYILHGLLQDTDNQLRLPHRLGRFTIPAPWMRGFMVSLMVAEVGSFTILFGGAIFALNS